MLTAELIVDDFLYSDGDRVWQSYLEVKIAAHPGLSDAQKQAVEFDFAMQNGMLTCKVREALVNYFLQSMRIGPDGLTREAKVQQFVLLNRAELAEYFW